MLKVFIPPSFIQERTYIVKVLLHHYGGYDIDIIPRSGQLHYEISYQDKSIVISDQFFGQTIVGETYLSPFRIPSDIREAATDGYDNILCIYGDDMLEISDQTITAEIDLFAGAFFMLTRWEESFGLHEDLHGRFPAAQALIVKEGFILRPVVDEYVALLKKWITYIGCPLPAKLDQFRVIPTCDVDVPFFWYRPSPFKMLLTRFLRHRKWQQLKEDRRIMRAVKDGDMADPYDTFDYMMTAAEKKGLHFKFHFLAGGETRFEGHYRLGDPKIKLLLKQMKERGHSIGLHPSYNAFHDLRMIEMERKELENHSGQKIYSSRQHYLRFAVPDTWNKLSIAFLKEDSTMGYAAEPGFRCGTSKPFPVFDVHARKELAIMEHPLLIMDVSLRFYKNFSVTESIEYCQQITAQVKKHHGELVFLWHNSSLGEVEEWNGWQKVFEHLLDQQ